MPLISWKTILVALLTVLVSALLAGIYLSHEDTGLADYEKVESPNIIFVTVDTLRYDHLPCYGYEIDTSPNICELKKDSYFFEKAYTPSSWTRLSMSSYDTGLYPYRTSATSKQSDTVGDAKTIQGLLSEEGYTSISISNLKHPYNIEYDEYMYPEKKTDLAAENVVREQVEMAKDVIDQDEKFYLHLHAWGPHHPNYPHEAARLDNESLDFYHEIERISDHPGYDADIYYTDRYIGEFIEHLKNKEMYEDSLVIVTSDHGEGNRDHGYGGHGKTLYEEEIRVPLLIKPPYEMDGQTISERKEILGIFEEILRFSSIDREKLDLGYRTDSRPIINTESQTITAFTDQHGHPPQNYMYTFIKDDMKYIYANNSWSWYENSDLGKGSFGGREETYRRIGWEKEEVYNLTEDPDEANSIGKHNLGFSTERLVEQNGLLQIRPENQDRDIEERLRNLGYIP